MSPNPREVRLSRAIWIVSVAVPLAVAILLHPDFPSVQLGFDTGFIPPLNATINGMVSLLLLAGLGLIRSGRQRMHRLVMLSAFGLSALFLVLYVLYHLGSGHTPYCAEGLVPRPLYLFILISHIFFSAFIIPLAGFTILRGITGQYVRHRRLARVAWPLWFYVAVSGVLVYVFNYPCYP
ncbi:MAG: DUF420 domain-containing protein [Flavobacteriales bacterium]|nr:DUF420 domain-containing protein [Flavobacteriales bacterium]MCX7769069.1 DUF420 domain-containing protein [Flavobacteriales bacterium]MDW8410742.1 DUF420 domain-containing protein [Flavobacteriales bacterium]